jgi:hypothetical protein
MIFPDVACERTSIWTIVRIAGRKLLTLLVSGGGLLGLTSFARQIARLDRVPVAQNTAGGGIIVRSEALRLWLPRAMIELAKRQSQSSPIRTHHELQQSLEGLDQRDAWYALTTRAYLANGQIIDLTTIRWPYQDSRYFPEVLDILAVAAGDPAIDRTGGSRECRFRFCLIILDRANPERSCVTYSERT